MTHIIIFLIGVIGFTLILNSYLEHHTTIVFGLSMEEANKIAADSCDDRDCGRFIVPYDTTPAFKER